MKLIWVCSSCNWVSVSDSKIGHCMETCKCGETSLDLEEDYMRCTGHPVFLMRYEKNKWTAIRNQKYR